LIYLEILLTIIALSIVLYYLVINIKNKIRFTLNQVFIVTLFFSLIFLTVQLLILLKPSAIPSTILGRIFIGTVMLTGAFLVNLVQIYPDGDFKKKLPYILIAAIPGFFVTYLSIGTNFIINKISLEEFIIYHPGKYFMTYGFMITIYLVFAGSMGIYKIVTLKNKVLSKELQYLFAGITLLFSILYVSSWILPQYYEIYMFRISGISLSWSVLVILMNYAVYDIKKIDFKRFYITLLSGIMTLALLFIPVLFIIKYNYIWAENYKIPGPALGILIFLYLFIFYKYIRQKIEYIFKTGILKLRSNLNEFFIPLAQLSHKGDQQAFWNNFYKITIGDLTEQYKIKSAYLFMINESGNNYDCIYNTGPDFKNSIPVDSIIIKSLNIQTAVIDTSKLHSDKKYITIKDEVLDFFNENEIEIAMPFFDHKNSLISFLLIGYLPGNKLYSRSFMQALELYRIQFQYNLANELYLETVKRTQLIEHDRLVVETIKKKIIPKSMKQVRGIRVSSFHVNISDNGGDYFDSIITSDNKVCLFMSDPSYNSIESAILSLELYTIFNTPSNSINSPGKKLNQINQILTTSKFTDKYAPSYCLTLSPDLEMEYSNGAFNPLLIFNPHNNNFNSFETKGIPVGVDFNFNYVSKSTKLIPGSIGILYSDGLVSGINNEGDAFTLEKVKKIVTDESENSPALISRKIYDEFSNFTDRDKLTNDASIIVFKV